MKIIFDSSSLILLIEKLCLREPFKKCIERGIQLIIPQAVWMEFTEKDIDEELLSFIGANFDITDVGISPDLEFFFKDDSGELEVSSLSKQFQENGIECFSVIDEKYGARVCKNNGIKTHGSIGLLLYLKGEGLITSKELIDIRQKIESTNFRIKKEHLDLLK